MRSMSSYRCTAVKASGCIAVLSRRVVTQGRGREIESQARARAAAGRAGPSQTMTHRNVKFSLSGGHDLPPRPAGDRAEIIALLPRHSRRRLLDDA